MPGPGAWKPADATTRINACARADDLVLSRKRHAVDQMTDRDLLMGDLLHVLKFGFVYDAAEPSTRQGFYRYKIEATTPNSDGRTVAAIVIPDGVREVKVVTVMWRDER